MYVLSPRHFVLVPIDGLRKNKVFLNIELRVLCQLTFHKNLIGPINLIIPHIHLYVYIQMPGKKIKDNTLNKFSKYKWKDNVYLLSLGMKNILNTIKKI